MERGASLLRDRREAGRRDAIELGGDRLPRGPVRRVSDERLERSPEIGWRCLLLKHFDGL
jgi:hypothetical protein